ncbi:CHASE3 domain-containing protein [Herbaspirillum sp. WKF16]|uniref:CHASE3 domain-containing protein n=1 Tax=Herbaspirillum sp. WKF16 TaxID=3028312 RepID=UPI0023A9428C|nr:CHASE3 domain-containing protein [Herbaspirillum sp. WKF16]WDZ96999.1 CHASE3 domain-containing protein [Herbaspirillum sp. WKF16]
MKLTDLRIGTRLYLGFGMVAAILVILVSVAYANFNRLSTANEWNTHTYVVRGEIKSTLESLLNIESGQRGFSLTGVDASLEPLNAGVRAFKEHLDRARELTADNPAQQERLRKLDEAERRWMAAAIEPALAMRRAVREGRSMLLRLRTPAWRCCRAAEALHEKKEPA